MFLLGCCCVAIAIAGKFCFLDLGRWLPLKAGFTWRERERGIKEKRRRMEEKDREEDETTARVKFHI